MKRLLIVMILIISILLTGCIQPYNITDEQSDEMAEYMAGLLLKYDKNYDQGLVPEDEINGTSVDGAEDSTDSLETSDETTDEGSANQGDTQNDYTLTQVIGASGFSVQYKGCKLVDTYPEDTENANFSLTPREEHQLLVASFLVKNKTTSSKEINLIKSGITYQLDVNTATIYKPLLTLLENDLQYLDIKIGAGKSRKVLLIFEIAKDAEITNISLSATRKNKSVLLELK